MKALFIGGIKSGKSRQAEAFALGLAERPCYLATTECFDDEMSERIARHKTQRSDRFETLEAPLDLVSSIQTQQNPILVECTTMWLNNMLFHDRSEEEILEHIDTVLALPNDIVFVHNDVGSGIIPDNALARRFADLSGVVAQRIAAECDEVYHCIAGLATRIK
jgi:adenosylcobinamide kinase/adenosylcobinamide-phosphate guanylyltransferase